MIKKVFGLLGGMGCAMALQACAVGADGTEESISTLDGNLTSTFTITNDWGGVYCGNVTVANNMPVAANRWVVFMDMGATSIQYVNGNRNVWGAVAGGNNGLVAFTQPANAAAIAPGGTTSFGFCGTASGYGPARPSLKDWSTSSSQYAACSTNNGLHPTRASLAVAMANELGRWKPDVDLMIGWNGKVALTSTGLARCTNGCANTKGILGQQDDAVSNYTGQETFNATVFRNDMIAAFNRNYTKIDDLTRNNPGALPPAHKLTLVGGPTNMGLGACGPHYIYKATDLNGNPLSSAQAANLANALCFYGQGSCGYNPYINFITTSQGCPSGQTCVAIDPDDYDNNSPGSTSAGTAPKYPMNRLWDPSNSKLLTKCTHTTGFLGQMKSKCSSNPDTCGFLYCMQ
jgi:hypothetical protein